MNVSMFDPCKRRSEVIGESESPVSQVIVV